MKTLHHTDTVAVAGGAGARPFGTPLAPTYPIDSRPKSIPRPPVLSPLPSEP